jgi:hypothetical protein
MGRHGGVRAMRDAAAWMNGAELKARPARPLKSFGALSLKISAGWNRKCSVYEGGAISPEGETGQE